MLKLVEGAGFEPAKALPPDLQSGPVDRLGNLSIGDVVTNITLLNNKANLINQPPLTSKFTKILTRGRY